MHTYRVINVNTNFFIVKLFLLPVFFLFYFFRSYCDTELSHRALNVLRWKRFRRKIIKLLRSLSNVSANF
jgi:hypothetical protein